MSRPASLPDSMASDDIDQVSEASQETLQTMDTEPPTQGIRDAEFLRKEIPDNEYEVLDSTVAHWPIHKYPQLGNRVTGPEFECGGQKWRILLFPFGNNAQDTISMYLECVHSKEEKDWVVCAQFVLAISNPNDPTVYYLNQAHHRFTSDEADWGFTRFLDLRSATEAGPGAKHPIMEGDNCVATAYIQVVKDPTGILWHNFQDYDSKKQTGHVGLHNQGATCYMNSLLQSLYCTNYFRKATYQIPTEKDDPTKSVALALQRVFYNLQFSSSTVETTELTRSFGWDSLDSFMQHDVQEFNRVLQDNLEEKMKGTAAEGAISKLFVGRMKSFIKCVNVDFESSRIENYYDIQLNVKGCKTLHDSFKDYCAEEMLEGDNKYMAEGHGLQDAKKGVIFESFPPVLHLQLKRFEYDMLRDTMVKINDRHEFPDRIDLEEFLSPEADRSQSWSYTLHGVLVHSGDLSGGHYFALLKPGKDSQWLKFDDDQVIPVTEREVFEENFGGEALGRHGRGGAAPTMRSVRPLNRYANAYMLVYIRESALDEVLAPVTADDIPRHLQDKIEEENRRSEAHKREQLEMHLTIETKLVTDTIVKPHQGFDLVDFQSSFEDESLNPLAFRVRRAMSAADYKRTVAEKLGKDPHDFRLWIMISRQNKTVRPDLLMPEDPALTIQEIKDTRSPRGMNLRLYVEMRDAHVPNQMFPSEAGHQFLMHLKYFDPLAGTMTGMGPIYVPETGLIGQILPTLWSRSQLDPDTPLMLFEEIKPGLIEKMDVNKTFVESEMQNGDIICFQRVLTEAETAQAGELDTVVKYFDSYANDLDVAFAPLEKAGAEMERVESIFLRLNKRLRYDEVAQRVAARLGCDPLKMRFSVFNVVLVKRHIIKRSENMSLSEMIRVWDLSVVDKVLLIQYEILPVPVDELESKQALIVHWLNGTVKTVVPVEVFVNEDETVGAVLTALSETLVKQGLPAVAPTAMRLYLVANKKIFSLLEPSTPAADLLKGPMVYGEAVGADERALEPDDMLMHVFHFHRDVFMAHSAPFYLLVKGGEPIADTLARLQQRLGVGEKEFGRIKVALVPHNSAEPPKYLEGDMEGSLSTLVGGEGGYSLGLDHPDPAPRTWRSGEKSIKIFN